MINTLNDVDIYAKVIWDYMLMRHDVKKADILFLLGSSDTRVAERGAELYRQGYAETIIVSGSKGKVTEGLFAESEARIFADVLIKSGVPEDKIILEEAASNTGDNIVYAYNMLRDLGHDLKSIILVTKPYMERRSYATFMKVWPESNMNLMVTSPQLAYDEYPSDKVSKDLFINLMVGDLQRIQEYPAKDWQIEQDIPKEVWVAYEQLVKSGFTNYLLK